MDFDLIQAHLVRCFEISKDDIMFLSRNRISELFEYSLKLDSFTPEINSRWAKYFPAGSYFSISKESNSTKLTLIISISDRDYDEFFYFIHPEIKLNKLGIVQNLEALKIEN